MITQTKETQSNLTPESALTLLKEGNKRFVDSSQVERNLLAQVSQTSTGQYPFAVVLSCIDSRVPAEVVFDQGIGDIFSVRVAGNIVNEDVLGSIEYSCKVAGSKVIVVMGHSKCGAVTAACKGVELGNITPLLEKIKPAVDSIKLNSATFKEVGMEGETIEEVSAQNVKVSIDRILKESPILAEMVEANAIKLVGAMYDVKTGAVDFY